MQSYGWIAYESLIWMSGDSNTCWVVQNLVNCTVRRYVLSSYEGLACAKRTNCKLCSYFSVLRKLNLRTKLVQNSIFPKIGKNTVQCSKTRMEKSKLPLIPTSYGSTISTHSSTTNNGNEECILCNKNSTTPHTIQSTR